MLRHRITGVYKPDTSKRKTTKSRAFIYKTSELCFPLHKPDSHAACTGASLHFASCKAMGPSVNPVCVNPVQEVGSSGEPLGEMAPGIEQRGKRKGGEGGLNAVLGAGFAC